MWFQTRRSPLLHVRLGLLLFAVLAAACGRGFKVRDYPTPEALYAGALIEFQRKHYDAAVEGFEKVTIELGSRDPLLPAAYLYLGRAYMQRAEYLIAANTFSRLSESFPEDSLADDAIFEQSLAYRQLWRKPTLDQQYGVLGQATLRSMLVAYPDSPLHDKALKELAALDEMLAAKDYEIGLHYKRRKAPDSAIIYFRDVMKGYPATDHARLAGLRLLELYREIKYTEDALDMCSALQKTWPGDKDVSVSCPTKPATATPPTKPAA